MDGPIVNWKFLESFAANTRAASDPKLLDLGFCGLHVVHGAFQAGHEAVGWIVSETLRDTYGLFKDNPACRTDYTVATSSTCFPKKILSDSLCGKFRCCCQSNRDILACEEIC